MHQHRCSPCKFRQCDWKLRGAPGRRRQPLSPNHTAPHFQSWYCPMCAVYSFNKGFLYLVKSFSQWRFRGVNSLSFASSKNTVNMGTNKATPQVNTHHLLCNTDIIICFFFKSQCMSQCEICPAFAASSLGAKHRGNGYYFLKSWLVFC